MFYGFWEKALPVEIFSGDCLFWAISELLKRAEAHGIKAVPKEHAGIITPPPFGTGLSSFLGHLTTS